MLTDLEFTALKSATNARGPRGRPRTMNAEELLEKNRKNASIGYYKKRVLKPKNQCSFVTRAGKRCVRTTFRERCFRHTLAAIEQNNNSKRGAAKVELVEPVEADEAAEFE